MELKSIVDSISKARSADVILCAGDIEPPAYNALVRELRGRQTTRQNAFLFLTTIGGTADTAYKIGRSLQNKYKNGRLYIFVNTICKSAGTLICAAANEIIMSDEAELGSLDVQLYKRDEIGERISGLTQSQALMTLRSEAFTTFENYLIELRIHSGFQITTRSAAELAARLTTGCFAPIYKQIDPMALGEHQRAMAIATAYGQRLDRGNLKPETLNQLTAGYPSHSFVIDRREASQLFHCVHEASTDEFALAELLAEHVEEAVWGQEPIVKILSCEQPLPTYDSRGGNDARQTAENEQHSPPAGGNGKTLAGDDGAEPLGDPSAEPAHSAPIRDRNP